MGDLIGTTQLTIVDILTWRSAVKAMADAKDKELKLRLPICEAILKTQNLVGRGKVKINTDVFDITAKRGVNVEVNEAILNQLADDNELTAEDLACFSWKLKISDKIHQIPKSSNVWKALSLTPARPTLKVKKKDQDGDSDD